MKIATVTCRELPEPDHDQEPLSAALRAAGHEESLIAWDEGEADWSAFDLVVIRSTWDYHRNLKRFLEWVRATDACANLHNPAETVVWNAHKRYLIDLAERGIPTVPTALIPAGSDQELQPLCEERGWRDVVVKPAASAGSYMTHRAGAADWSAGESHLAALRATEDVLVQPYQTSVEGHGERAVCVIGGEPTHAVRKSPRFGDDAEAVELVPIEEDEAALAREILAEVAPGLLYARVDLARDEQGKPQVMELELIEPSLFFRQHPPALDAYLAALERYARG